MKDNNKITLFLEIRLFVLEKKNNHYRPFLTKKKIKIKISEQIES